MKSVGSKLQGTYSKDATLRLRHLERNLSLKGRSNYVTIQYRAKSLPQINLHE